MASWVDSSDDESLSADFHKEFDGFVVPNKVQRVNGNIDTVEVIPDTVTEKKPMFIDEVSDSSSSSDEEEGEDSIPAVVVAPLSTLPSAPEKKFTLNKKELKVLKKKQQANELDVLDALLNDFGVNPDGNSLSVEGAEVALETPVVPPEGAGVGVGVGAGAGAGAGAGVGAGVGTGTGANKKKKKKKKEKKKEEEPKETGDGVVLDVRAVLAAKKRKKEATMTGIQLAAIAEKERQQNESKKKKEKKKDLGKGGSKKDIVAHVGHSSNY